MTNPSVREAHTWLYAAQEPDGSWDARRWGGDRRFQPALTALPLLALLEAADQPTAEQKEAQARAEASLCRAQDEHGAFGPTFQMAPYNQGIATLALLHAYQREPAPELRKRVEAALALIVQRQTPEGGWGYLYTPLPNLSVSLWHIECLRVALDLGWEQARQPLERSLAWQSAQATRRAGSAGTSQSIQRGRGASLALPNLDYCDVYFRTAALRHASDAASQRQLKKLQQALRVAQIRSGKLSGSWGPDDRWSKVGGRLYTTSLAALALK